MITNNPEIILPATAAIATHPSSTAVQGVKPHRLIKLGVDVHWREHVVVRQVDGLSPQPAQRFTPEAFVAWVAKQVQQADVVHSCYEAGPFGFVLHRRLVSLGVKSLVVRPHNWDEYGKKVKTDRRDALALVSCLDRYVAGNTEALTSIRVPTESEEQSRSVTRHREQRLEHRKRFAAQGLSCARYYGHDLPDEWWRAKRFEALRAELPEFLFTLLESVQRIALVVHTQLDALREQIESAQTELLPTGLGARSRNEQQRNGENSENRQVVDCSHERERVEDRPLAHAHRHGRGVGAHVTSSPAAYGQSAGWPTR